MKLRTSLTALCFVAATIGSSIDLYNLHQLPDQGFGGRGRHIASWGRHMAMAVGYTHDGTGANSAAAWPEITDAGPGPLVDLPTPDAALPSTAASYVQLIDGRYLIVGQWTESGGMRRSAIWLNSTGAPLTYMGMALPQASGSTGSEAHDIVNLPGGSVAVVGHDWPVINGVIQWVGCVWRISPTGQIQQTFLPKPAGTGWSKAYSVGQDIDQPGALTIVGSIQEVPNGPWRACRWRFNPSTGQSFFKYMGNGQMESYAYRINPSGTFSVGWLEDDLGIEFSAFWDHHQACTRTNLQREGRLYGIDDRGYFVGTQRHSNSMSDGLIGHVAYRESDFDFSSLVKDWGGLTLADHLWCRAEHGQVTGCTTWGTSYLPIAGVPTGEHGFDDIDLRRGRFEDVAGAPSESTFLIDDTSLNIRSQQRQVVFDGSILSAPLGFDGAQITIALDISGDDMVTGKLLAFNWQTQQYEPATALPFSWGANQTATGAAWATFPSSWRSASGEVRFRLQMLTDDRRDIVNIDAMVFKTN